VSLYNSDDPRPKQENPFPMRGRINVYRILVGAAEWKGPFERPRRMWGDDKEIGNENGLGSS